MLIDMFTYSHETDNCPTSLESLIEAAKNAHLDGICVTDRGRSAHAQEMLDIAKRAKFFVGVGLELDTKQGRVAVYPAKIDDAFINEDWLDLGDLPETSAVLDYFHARGDVVIARDVHDGEEGFKERVFSTKGQNGRGFDGIDTIAAYRRRSDNEKSIEAQQRLNLPACAGSSVFDKIDDIGHCATIFTQNISNQAELIDALKTSSHWACALRDLGDACPIGTPPPEDDRNQRYSNNSGDRRSNRSNDRRGQRNDRSRSRR